MPVGSSSGFIRSSSMMPDGRRTEPDGRRTDQDAQFSGKVANKRPKVETTPSFGHPSDGWDEIQLRI